MDALERRVADRMTLEARQLRAEQMKFGKRRQAIMKDAEKAHGASKRLFDAFSDGKLPTKAVADAGAAALKTLAKAARDLMAVNEKMAANAEALARLEDPHERARRVEQARALGANDQPLTAVDAAEMVLVTRGKATHVTDLTDAVLETGVVKLLGKTPSQTMSASLAKEAARPDGRFVRIAPGVFDLRHREQAKEPAAS